MKKFICLAALVGIVFTGCTKKEVPVMSNSDRQITFSTPLVAPATKANVVFDQTDFNVTGKYYTKTGAAEVEGSFLNVGWTNGVLYIPSQQCTEVASFIPMAGYKSWSTAKPYYWPKAGSGALAFQAFAPHSLNDRFEVAADGTGVKTKSSQSYEVDKTLATATDVLYSGRVIDQTDNATIESPEKLYGVQLVFRHALSKIQFKARTTADLDHAEVKIKSIVLTKVYNKGTFAQGLNDKAKDFDSENPTWTAVGEPTPAKVDYSDCVGETPIALTNAEFTADATKLATKTLYVMPQKIYHKGNASDPSNNEMAAFEITYTTAIKDGVGTVIADTEDETIATVLLKDLNFSDAEGESDWIQFSPAKLYTFEITVGLNQIYFAPVIEDWTPVTVNGDKLTI